MHQVAEWPGIMIVHDVGLARESGELRKGPKREGRGSYFESSGRPMNRVAVKRRGFAFTVRAERKHIDLDATPGCAARQLVNELLDASTGIRKISFEEMQNLQQ